MVPPPREDDELVVYYWRTFNATDIGYQVRDGDKEPCRRAGIYTAKVQVFVKHIL